MTPSYQVAVTPGVGRSVGIAEHAAIATLAEAVGIEPGYRDTDGHIQQTSVESQRGILQAMGFDLSSEASLHAALHQREAADWHRLVAPVTVLRRSPGAIPSVTLTLPEALLSRPLKWCVELENGSTRAGTLVPESLDHLEHRSESLRFVRAFAPAAANGLGRWLSSNNPCNRRYRNRDEPHHRSAGRVRSRLAGTWRAAMGDRLSAVLPVVGCKLGHR